MEMAFETPFVPDELGWKFCAWEVKFPKLIPLEIEFRHQENAFKSKNDREVNPSRYQLSIYHFESNVAPPYSI